MTALNKFFKKLKKKKDKVKKAVYRDKKMRPEKQLKEEENGD